MTTSMPAKTHRHSLAQWIAACALALLLPGCGGGSLSQPPQDAQTQKPPPADPFIPRTVPPPVDPFVPRTAPAATIPASADDAYFKQKKLAFEDREYETSNHLRLINASAAYARGATGKGEIVAVTDDHIDTKHIQFDVFGERFAPVLTAKDLLPPRKRVTVVVGSKVRVTTQRQKKCFRSDDVLPCEDYDPGQEAIRPTHGTKVAALIAARRGELLYKVITWTVGDKTRTYRPDNMQGVAYDSRLYFHQVALRGTIEGLGTLSADLSEWTEDQDKKIAAQFFDLGLVRDNGAFVVNHSFIWPILRDIDHHDEDVVREKFKHTAAAMAQKDIPDADKIIVVRAAGNERNKCLGKVRCTDPNGGPAPDETPLFPTSPAVHSGLGVHFPELRSHVLAVVAVDPGGVLADFSNPCGSAKDFCLAAPGVDLLTATTEGQHTFISHVLRGAKHEIVSGTSFAAPLVSGSLAVMRQFFKRQLGNTELVTRL
ncbi:MAG: S8 family serine peptidase, partial [Gammaproteobacteria bacterium]